MTLGIVQRKNPRRLADEANGNQKGRVDDQESAVVTKRKRFRPSSRPTSNGARAVIPLLLIFVVACIFFPKSFDRYEGVYLKIDNKLRWNTAGEKVFPIVVRLLSKNETFSTSKSEKTFPRPVEPMISAEIALELEDDALYRKRSTDEFETDECKAQHEWQLKSFPTCNQLHEIDMSQVSTQNHPESDGKLHLVNHGFWRDVWVIQGNSWDQKTVLKTLRTMHNTTNRNLDRNRRDALVMERLTRSPWVLDIYSFCANSGLSEYADGGDISTAIWPEVKGKDGRTIRIIGNMTKREQFIIAVQASISLAEMHTFDDPDRPSVAHTDISPTQFVKVAGNRFKLNDFNRARFLRWKQSTQDVCPFQVGKNPGKNRSPEEYTPKEPLTEKIDIYSLGNVFYMLLQKEYPFNDVNTKVRLR